MMKSFVLIFFIVLAVKPLFAGEESKKKLDQDLVMEWNALEGDSTIADVKEVRKVKFKRGKAILFTIFTGILGGHRIYMGTHQRTPILYSVTLGGLGILPLIDLAHIIFTKDLSKFEGVTQIVMWGR